MKLLFVNLSKEWGGGERWHLSVAGEMKQRGHVAHLMAYPGSKLAHKAKAAGLAVYPASVRTLSLLNPLKMISLSRTLRRIRPDAVILNASHELKSVGMAARMAGVRQIIFRRGVSYPLSPTAVNRWYLRHIVTALLSNAQRTREAMVCAFPFLKEKPGAVILNGIDPGEWPQTASAGNGNTIGIVSRLSKEKGIELAIAAIALLRNKGIPAQLRIIGDGPERQLLESQCREAGITDHVSFLGFHEDVHSPLSACDIFLHSARYGEGTTLALLEAMCMGLPAVVSDSPAIGEAVIEGVTGFLVPVGDTKAMAAKLQLLIEDDELRYRMGMDARKHVLDRFTLERVGDQLEAWLMQL